MQRELDVKKRMRVALVETCAAGEAHQIFADELLADEAHAADIDRRRVPSAADNRNDERAADEPKRPQQVPSPLDDHPDKRDHARQHEADGALGKNR